MMMRCTKYVDLLSVMYDFTNEPSCNVVCCKTFIHHGEGDLSLAPLRPPHRPERRVMIIPKPGEVDTVCCTVPAVHGLGIHPAGYCSSMGKGAFFGDCRLETG